MKKYIHPQGATCVVYDDGSLAKFDKNGKATKTSATAEKLARGHGGWVLVEGDEVDFTQFNSDREAVPGGVVRIPMKFKSAPIDDLGKYVADDDYFMQQKIDGIRAQIAFTAGSKGCWVRSNSGERLKSSASAPTVVAIEKRFEHFMSNEDYCIDGEIINGVFWAFDLVNETPFPLMKRLLILGTWMQHAPDEVKLLPTAHSRKAKQELVNRVITNCGEGFIVKRKDSGYTWGGRVEHSLKIKLVETVDCVVGDVGIGGKDNILLDLYDTTGNTVCVGCTSTIGKGSFEIGDVVEVQYLYAGAGGKLVQPTILQKRLDKKPDECYIDQLKYVNKEVITNEGLSSGSD